MQLVLVVFVVCCFFGWLAYTTLFIGRVLGFVIDHQETTKQCGCIALLCIVKQQDFSNGYNLLSYSEIYTGTFPNSNVQDKI